MKNRQDQAPVLSHTCFRYLCAVHFNYRYYNEKVQKVNHYLQEYGTIMGKEFAKKITQEEPGNFRLKLGKGTVFCNI